MEHSLLVPVSEYNNKKLLTQIITKRELPKYQAEQSPNYISDSLEKELNKKLFAIADSLVDNVLSCPRTKFSDSQIRLLDSVESRV